LGSKDIGIRKSEFVENIFIIMNTFEFK